MEQEVMDGCIKPQMQRWAGIEVFGATEVRVCIVEKTDRVRSFIVIGNLFGGPCSSPSRSVQSYGLGRVTRGMEPTGGILAVFYGRRPNEATLVGGDLPR